MFVWAQSNTPGEVATISPQATFFLVPLNSDNSPKATHTPRTLVKTKLREEAAIPGEASQYK